MTAQPPTDTYVHSPQQRAALVLRLLAVELYGDYGAATLRHTLRRYYDDATLARLMAAVRRVVETEDPRIV